MKNNDAILFLLCRVCCLRQPSLKRQPVKVRRLVRFNKPPFCVGYCFIARFLYCSLIYILKIRFYLTRIRHLVNFSVVLKITSCYETNLYGRNFFSLSKKIKGKGGFYGHGIKAVKCRTWRHTFFELAWLYKPSNQKSEYTVLEKNPDSVTIGRWNLIKWNVIRISRLTVRRLHSSTVVFLKCTALLLLTRPSIKVRSV